MPIAFDVTMLISLEPGSRSLNELYSLAVSAAQSAYAPYSSFRVGAAVLTSASEVVTGCNVENASFRLTTCAEQNAIASAVARFGPEIRITALAVANLNGASCQPCGACRQTLAEFAEPECRILYPSAEGTPVEVTLADLLPDIFHLRAAGSRR